MCYFDLGDKEVLAKFLMATLVAIIGLKVSKKQWIFFKGKKCQDQMFEIKQLRENLKETAKKVFNLALMKLEKVFDKYDIESSVTSANLYNM